MPPLAVPRAAARPCRGGHARRRGGSALPLFLHRHYQPSVSVGPVDVVPLRPRRARRARDGGLDGASAASGASPRHGAVWVALGALALLVLWGVAWGAVHFPALPDGHARRHGARSGSSTCCSRRRCSLIVRGRARPACSAAASLIAWSCVATAVGVLQFVGALGNLDHTPAGRRKPSLLGDHDFAALSASALALALFVLARGARTSRERRGRCAAGIAGGGRDDRRGRVRRVRRRACSQRALIVVLLRPGRAARRARSAGSCSRSPSGIVAIRSQAVADGLKFLGVKPARHERRRRHPELPPANAARLHRRPDLPRPPGARRRLAGLRRRVRLQPVRRRREAPVRRSRSARFRRPRIRGACRTRTSRALADLGVVGLVALLARVARAGRVRGAARHAATRASPAPALDPRRARRLERLRARRRGSRSTALTWLAVGAAALAGSLHEPLTDGRVGCARAGPEDQLAREKPARAVASPSPAGRSADRSPTGSKQRARRRQASACSTSAAVRSRTTRSSRRRREYVGLDVAGQPGRRRVRARPRACRSTTVRSTSCCAPRCSSMRTTRPPSCESCTASRAPGGRVLASTHGVMVFHPNPYDHWRWTHTGLRKLFARTPSGSSSTIAPGAGTAAGVGLVVGRVFHLLAKRLHVTPLRPALRRHGQPGGSRTRRARDRAARAGARCAVRELPRHGRASRMISSLMTRLA